MFTENVRDPDGQLLLCVGSRSVSLCGEHRDAFQEDMQSGCCGEGGGSKRLTHP